MLNFVLLFGVASIIFWLLQKYDTSQKKLPPGPFRWPLVGNMVQLLMEDAKYAHIALTKISSKFGDIAFFQTGLTYSVTINGYDAVKRALTSDDFHNRMDDKWLLDRTYGKPWGLINSNGEFWKQSRRFTMRHLRDFGFAKRADMNTFISRELSAMKSLIEAHMDSKATAIIQPKDLVVIPTVNIVWSSVSGDRFELTDPLAHNFVHYMHEFTRSMQFAGGIANAFPFVLDWFPGLMGKNKIDENVQVLQTYMKKLVTDYRGKGSYKEKAENFIEAYLQAIDAQVSPTHAPAASAVSNPIFTDENLMTIVFDLFWAGIETTSTILSFTFLYLVMYPDIQKKMRDEINSLVDQGTEITIEDRPKLNYCRAVGLEAFRRNSIVPLGPRKVFKDTHFNGYTIPANTTVLMNYYGVNMDKEFWGDPENFRPERFLDPNGAIVNSERVLAFSMGKRDCVGYSIAESALFVISTRLVQNYEFLAVAGHKYDLEPLPGLSVAPQPFPLKLKKLY